MKEEIISDYRIIQIADLLEQIKAVDEMITLHKDDKDDLMLSQYQYRRTLFIKKMKELLIKLNIQPNDLLAA